MPANAWWVLLAASLGAGLSGGALGAWLMGMFPRHTCHDEPVAVSEVSGLAAFGAPARTDLLLKCAGCGQVTAVTLAGSWTLAQVRGEVFGDEPVPALSSTRVAEADPVTLA